MSQSDRSAEALEKSHLWDLLFWSFFLSQGYEGLQRSIFEYIKLQHPELRINPQHTKTMINEFAAKMRTFIPKTTEPTKSVRHFAIDEDNDISYTCSRQMIELAFILNPVETILSTTWNRVATFFAPKTIEKRKEEHRTRVAKRILQMMLDRDQLYLSGTNSRGRRGKLSGKEHHSFLTDPWLSHIEHFIIDGHRLGVPEYDALHDELAFLARKRMHDRHDSFATKYHAMIRKRNKNRAAQENIARQEIEDR